MFQLTDEEWESLRSQIATSKKGRGGRRYPPLAFTEHGVLMLSRFQQRTRSPGEYPDHENIYQTEGHADGSQGHSFKAGET